MDQAHKVGQREQQNTKKETQQASDDDQQRHVFKKEHKTDSLNQNKS